MRSITSACFRRLGGSKAFSRVDLLVLAAVICLLLAMAVAGVSKVRQAGRLARCTGNLAQISRAITLYAGDNQKTLPLLNDERQLGTWWFYKEQVKGYLGLNGKSSPNDVQFACPNDRGFEESPTPFSRSAKFDYGSYCFNGVTLPGVPNIAGKKIDSIRDPNRTLLVMEWTAHAPLSWHNSKTGSKNSPFYDGAESVVAYVDGHVKLSPIYYDGMNAAYTREPIPGYDYKYGPE